MTPMPQQLTGGRDAPTLTAAVDFGISNTDVVVRRGDELITWSQPYTRDPDEASVVALLAAHDVDLSALPWLAVTGGRHRVLSDFLCSTSILKISEVQALSLIHI